MSIGAFQGSAKERLSAMADGELDGAERPLLLRLGQDADLRADGMPGI